VGKEKNYQNVEKLEKWRKPSVLKHFAASIPYFERLAN